MRKIRSAAELVAASKCTLSRPESIYPMQSIHRRVEGEVVPCYFCQFSYDELQEAIAETHRWNDHNNGGPFNDFDRLATSEQQRRVLRAQYPDDSSVATE